MERQALSKLSNLGEVGALINPQAPACHTQQHLCSCNICQQPLGADNNMTSLQDSPLTGSAVLATSIGSAVLYLTLVRSPPSVWRMTVKTASTALLSTVAAVRGGPLLLVGALALGSLGDAFLAWDDETSFLCGLASFLVAHLFYIAAFFHNNTGGVAAFQAVLGGWRAMIAGALALLVPVMIASLMPRIGSELRPPVVIYSLAIFAMALTALTLDSVQLITGTVMFAASDSILSADRFLVSPTSLLRPWMQHAVWILYYIGQLLIVLGFLSL